MKILNTEEIDASDLPNHELIERLIKHQAAVAIVIVAVIAFFIGGGIAISMRETGFANDAKTMLTAIPICASSTK